MPRWAALTIVLLVGAGLSPARAGGSAALMGRAACRACHAGENANGVAASQPQLASRLADQDTAQQGPGLILLDMLKGQPRDKDFFGPVPFNHAGHARMADNCTVCHHHTPEGQAHPECRSCHEPQLVREDIAKPSLKGAYHRQCMGCHREWAQGDHCQSCHRPIGEANASGELSAAALYMGKPHPVIAKPDVEIYQTEHRPGVKSRVVFSHKHHIERYGNSCVDCHRSDNCMRCHEAGKQHVQRVRTPEEHHQSCVGCHRVDDEARCGDCHRKPDEPAPKPFDHADTGWPLASYHQAVNCRGCHKQTPFTSLDKRCSACHSAPAAETQAARTRSGASGPRAHQPFLGYVRSERASGEVCVACHQDLAEDAPGQMHPQPVLKRGVPEKLVQAGARGRAGQKMDCLACHSTATARFEPIVVGDSGSDGLCLTCHRRQASIFGTLHDIRSEPSGRGRRAGTQPATSMPETRPAGGTCRTCHPAHRPARTPVVTAGDPAGQCTACHQPRGWAQAKPASTFPHPRTACSDCHNPHESRHKQFLIAPVAELCAMCHAEEARMAGGPHDPSRRPETWPDKTAAAKGLCLACHLPHSNDTKTLLRFPPPQADAGHDGACLACHPKEAWGSKGDRAILHPHDISPDQKKVSHKKVPTDEAGHHRMTCRTCHDPHGGAKPGYLINGQPDEPAGVCLSCHEQKKYMEQTGHATERLAKLGFDAGQCRPCHAMHASPDKTWGQMLSPRFLDQHQVGATSSVSDGIVCLACHHSEGPAPVRAVTTHPPIFVPNMVAPEAPGYLPLFDSAGLVSRNGQITCRTCHLSHGRLDLLQLAAKNGKLSDAERRAMRLNLRAFIAPNICTQCHGQEAQLRFMLFHDPARRAKLPAR